MERAYQMVAVSVAADKNRYNDIRKSFGDVFKRSEKISQIDRMVKVIHRLGENTSVCTGIDIS